MLASESIDGFHRQQGRRCTSSSASNANETATHKEASLQQQRADWQAVATATGF